MAVGTASKSTKILAETFKCNICNNIRKQAGAQKIGKRLEALKVDSAVICKKKNQKHFRRNGKNKRLFHENCI